jgi:acyl-CoA thioesterase
LNDCSYVHYIGFLPSVKVFLKNVGKVSASWYNISSYGASEFFRCAAPKNTEGALMNELEQLAAERTAHNAFMHHNFIEMVRVETDHSVFRLTIRDESRNPFGLLHGGAIYTLADNATGAATHTDGRLYVTQTSSLHFLRNQAEGTVYATAAVRHRGHATCLTTVDITSEDGKLLATGEFTFFCVDKALMDQKAPKGGY